MSGVSISSMIAAAAALRTMEVEVNDAGTTRKVTIDQILSLLPIAGPCRVATTANLSSLSGLLTVDGVTVAAGDRVLVKDQTTASANGIYAAASGSWTRATDADAWTELAGRLVPVMQGTVNADRLYLCTSDPGGTLGTTSVAFARVDGTTTDPRATAKAWVNFNGTGTVAIRNQFNVSSITDNGVGDYTVNFTTAMADANYSMAGSSDQTGSFGRWISEQGSTRTTSALRVIVCDGSSTRYDQANNSVIIFGA